MKKHYLSSEFGLFITKSLITISIFLICLIPLKGIADNLTAVAATGSDAILQTPAWETITTTAGLTVATGDKVMVIASFTNQTTSAEKVARDMIFRIVQDIEGAPSYSNEIIRYMAGESGGDKGIGTLVYVFTIGSETSPTYTLQHSQSKAKASQTTATITAINLTTSGAEALDNSFKAFTTAVTTASTSFVEVGGTVSDAITLPIAGGVYFAASINSASTASDTDKGEWQLQYQEGGTGGTWLALGSPVQRTFSGTKSNGIISLVGLLENQPAGTYYFRLAYRVSFGSFTLETSNTSVVGVALSTGGGTSFSTFKDEPVDQTNSTTSWETESTNTFTAAGTQAFFHAQYGMSSSNTSNAPGFKFTVSGGSVTQNINYRALSSSSDAGSGGQVGLMTGLSASTSYSAYLQSQSTGVLTLTISDIYFVGFQLTDGMASGFWDGSESRVWETDANWEDGVAPTASTNVYIPNVANDPIIGGTTLRECASLQIASGATLDIEDDGSLTVSGDLDNDGTFTVNSTTDGTGSLIVAGSSSGDVVFKRYVDDSFSKALKWHYVSAPVAGQDLNIAWMTANSISFASPAYQFYRWDEDKDYWIYFNYDGLGALPESFGDATFVESRGYCITRTEADALSFTGTVRVEDVSYAVTYTALKGVGCNLTGNPFTSAIGITNDASSTEKFLAQNTVLLDDSYEALYIWDEESGYNGSRNDYNVISNAAITGYDTPINQDYIQPGQAFMVKVVSGGGSLAFNENMQAHATVDYYKNTKELWPSVELIVENNELSNSTAIGFNENMTLGLDPSYDVGKMKGNPDIALYTKLVEDNGVDFAIQALPPLNEDIIKVKIGLDVSHEGDYNFKLFESENLDNTTSIKLEDKETGELINFSETNEYSFNISESGQIRERFILHFNNATGIEDQIIENNNIRFYVYENKLFIIDKELKKGTIQLFNMLGQPVMEKQYSESINTIELNLSKGHYIVRIVTDKANISGKIYIH